MERARAFGFDAAERRTLAAALARGDALTCPRCAVALSVQQVDPKPGLAYVRHRVWVVCPNCHGSAALDRMPT